MAKDTPNKTENPTRNNSFRGSFWLVFMMFFIFLSVFFWVFYDASKEFIDPIHNMWLNPIFIFYAFGMWFIFSFFSFFIANKDDNFLEDGWFPPKDLFFYRILIILMLFPFFLLYFILSLICFVVAFIIVSVLAFKK